MQANEVAQQFRVFKYETPTEWSEVQKKRGKQSVNLARAGGLLVGVQVVTHGGETNLHAHTDRDSTWLVLKGRARFYGTDDVVVGELGSYEGIVIPAGVPYWFESASSEQMEILHITAQNGFEGGRINHQDLLPQQADRHHDGK